MFVSIYCLYTTIESSSVLAIWSRSRHTRTANPNHDSPRTWRILTSTTALTRSDSWQKFLLHLPSVPYPFTIHMPPASCHPLSSLLISIYLKLPNYKNQLLCLCVGDSCSALTRNDLMWWLTLQAVNSMNTRRLQLQMPGYAGGEFAG